MTVSIHKMLTGFVVCAAVFLFGASTAHAITYTHGSNPVASFIYTDANTFSFTYVTGTVLSGLDTNIRLRGDDGESTITFQPATTGVRVKVGEGNAIIHPMTVGQTVSLSQAIFQEVDDFPLGNQGGGTTGGGNTGGGDEFPGGDPDFDPDANSDTEFPLGDPNFDPNVGNTGNGGTGGTGGTGGSGQPQVSPDASRSTPGSRMGISNPLKNITSIPGFIEALFDRIVIPIGVSIAVLFIIYSGFLFVVAQGNEQKLTQAKATFMWTVIGTAILLGSWAIAVLIKNTVEQLRADVPQHIVYEDISQ